MLHAESATGNWAVAWRFHLAVRICLGAMYVFCGAVRSVGTAHVQCLLLQIGFLYLRYVLDPRTIWDWLQYYIKDREVRGLGAEHLTQTVYVGLLTGFCDSQA